MKISDSRSAYQDFSAKASDLARTLCFSSIAIIWVFKQDTGAGAVIPKELFTPALFTVLALGFDLLQYVSATVFWGMFTRHKERMGVSSDDVFKAPHWINLPAIIFFYLKLVSILITYLFLFGFMIGRFR